MKIDINTLRQYETDGWVRSQTHPELPLIIWNYTQNTQYMGHWDDVTLLTRGLVTDTKGIIVAHPMKKFFNYSELKAHNKIPSGDFTIYEKLDGSYIQVFSYQDELIVSSKGSFTSIQVEMATEILDSKFADWCEVFDPEYNYIFELIHPENRIVLDYGDDVDLVLIGLIKIDGFEYPVEHYKDIFTLPKVFTNGENLHWDQYESIINNNEEGFVIKFTSGERMKIKGEEYKRLHQIVTQTSSKDIWKALRDRADLREFIERVPDEYLTWFYKTVGELHVAYDLIYQQFKRDWDFGQERGLYYLADYGNWEVIKPRKDIALYFNSCQYPGLMFHYLDTSTFNDEAVWNMIRPEFQKAFSI